MSLDIRHLPLRQKCNLILIIKKSCLKNTVSILHISLDIKNSKFYDLDISNAKKQ